jgi:drug/metabolite transporter (DMT)-like permease
MTRRTGSLLFLLMCLVWGLTWIAIKTGIASVPPLFFAGTRFVAAGLLLLLWQRIRGERIVVRRADWRAMGIASLLMIVGTYSLLFWGMSHVSSGLSAVINLSLTPVALFGVGLAYGEERFRLRQSAAILLGIVGLLVLFQPSAAAPRDPLELRGIAAVVGGSLAYSWGSVLSRPLLRAYSPLLVSAVTCVIGGPVLIGMALVFEPVGYRTLAAFASPGVAASWLFLVLCGSLAAFTIYLRLVRDWGAARAGMYAFVSPALAVAVGVTLAGERIAASELVGMAIMLAATAFAVGGRATEDGRQMKAEQRRAA